MRVTVRLFARLRDLAGSGELVRDVTPPATVLTIWTSLVAEFPALAEYERSMSVAVNAEYSRMTTAVNEGDEVAFLPPVSGGEWAAEAGPHVTTRLGCGFMSRSPFHRFRGGRL
jgi:molybdopterin converting factor subunit 1